MLLVFKGNYSRHIFVRGAPTIENELKLLLSKPHFDILVAFGPYCSLLSAGITEIRITESAVCFNDDLLPLCLTFTTSLGLYG